MIMYISFSLVDRPELECGRCGALVTNTARHVDWHRDFGEGGLETSSGHGSLETSSGHGSLETSSGHGAVLSEDQAVEHGLVPDPERTVPPTSSEVAREEERLRRITGRRDLRLYPFPAPVHAVPSVFMEAVYSYEQDRARSQELDTSLRDLSERLDREDGQQTALAQDDAAVAEVMRRQGATAAQIAREQEAVPQSSCPDPFACPCVAAAVADAMLRQGAPVRHGTDDTYPYGGGEEQPSDAGIGPQPLTDPITGHRRTPE